MTNPTPDCTCETGTVTFTYGGETRSAPVRIVCSQHVARERRIRWLAGMLLNKAAIEARRALTYQPAVAS